MSTEDSIMVKFVHQCMTMLKITAIILCWRIAYSLE